MSSALVSLCASDAGVDAPEGSHPKDSRLYGKKECTPNSINNQDLHSAFQTN